MAQLYTAADILRMDKERFKEWLFFERDGIVLPDEKEAVQMQITICQMDVKFRRVDLRVK